MKKMVGLASGLTLLAVAQLGMAQPPAGGAAPPGGGGGMGRGAAVTFEALDADKNGSLSQKEVTDYFAAQAAARGGAAPGGAPPGGGAAPPGGAAGAPGGGRGGFDPAVTFGNWDADKNGSVSKAEFDARPRGGRGGPGGAPGGGGGPPGGGAPRGAPPGQ